MDWLFTFPHLSPDLLPAVKRAVDGGLKALTRSYGQGIEDVFHPLQVLFFFCEQLIVAAPGPWSWPRLEPSPGPRRAAGASGRAS